MDAIIYSIIELEHKAQEIVDGAKEEKQKMLTEAKQRCESLKDDIVKRQENRLNKVAEHEKAIIDERMAEIGKESDRKQAELERRFAAGKDGWIREIVQNLIGGEKG